MEDLATTLEVECKDVSVRQNASHRLGLSIGESSTSLLYGRISPCREPLRRSLWCQTAETMVEIGLLENFLGMQCGRGGVGIPELRKRRQWRTGPPTGLFRNEKTKKNRRRYAPSPYLLLRHSDAKEAHQQWNTNTSGRERVP